MSGQLIADSYTGNTAFNQVTFDGNLPTPVPLPGAAVLLGSGLLGFAARRRSDRVLALRFDDRRATNFFRCPHEKCSAVRVTQFACRTLFVWYGAPGRDGGRH